jgi:hypothetical protein
MASLEIKSSFKLDELQTIVAALQQWRRIQAFNRRAIAGTPDEKNAAMQEMLRVEQILRTMSIEPDSLTQRIEVTEIHQPKDEENK